MDADKMTYAECVDYARYLHWKIGSMDYEYARSWTLGDGRVDLAYDDIIWADSHPPEAAREFSWACIDKYRLRPGPSDTE